MAARTASGQLLSAPALQERLHNGDEYIQIKVDVVIPKIMVSVLSDQVVTHVHVATQQQPSYLRDSWCLGASYENSAHPQKPRRIEFVLLTRKSFAAWKEFFFADFFALFASWRLIRDSMSTAKTRRTQRKRQEHSLVATS